MRLPRAGVGRTDLVNVMKVGNGRIRRMVLALVAGTVAAGSIAGTPSLAQTVGDDTPQATPAAGLNIPSNLQIFGHLDPNIRKPTAIVNDTVITGTDVDQRVNLIIAANQLSGLSDADRDRLRLQILRGLIDETLQIQHARTADVTITPDEINQSYARVAANFQRTVPQMQQYLRSIGSSDATLRRQIEAELAWSRFLRRRIQPFVNVSDEEVQGVIQQLQARRGSEEYHLKEIYLSADPARAPQVQQQAAQMIQQMQAGTHPFEYFAQFSEATTRSTGGDLGWINTAQLSTLPTELAQSATTMQVGQIAGPIAVGGGFSILYLADKRRVLEADPRDARLTLKQLTVHFPAGATHDQAAAEVARFGTALHTLQGCGDVPRVAGLLNAEIVENAQITVRDLPPALQTIMLQLQIGQSTPPFGSPSEGVRALVLCGRDDPQAGSLPSSSQLQNQMEETRVNLRAQNLLRDLRRDAVIEYR